MAAKVLGIKTYRAHLRQVNRDKTDDCFHRILVSTFGITPKIKGIRQSPGRQRRSGRGKFQEQELRRLATEKLFENQHRPDSRRIWPVLIGYGLTRVLFPLR